MLLQACRRHSLQSVPDVHLRRQAAAVGAQPCDGVQECVSYMHAEPACSGAEAEERGVVRYAERGCCRTRPGRGWREEAAHHPGIASPALGGQLEHGQQPEAPFGCGRLQGQGRLQHQGGPLRPGSGHRERVDREGPRRCRGRNALPAEGCQPVVGRQEEAVAADAVAVAEGRTARGHPAGQPVPFGLCPVGQRAPCRYGPAVQLQLPELGGGASEDGPGPGAQHTPAVPVVESDLPHRAPAVRERYVGYESWHGVSVADPVPLRRKSYAGLWLGGGPVGLQYSKQGTRSGENGGADTGMRPYALGREEIPVSGGQTSTGKRKGKKKP